MKRFATDEEKMATAHCKDAESRKLSNLLETLESLNTHAHEEEPRGLPSEARCGAPLAAIGCTAGLSLGCGRVLVSRARVLLMMRAVRRQRRHKNTPSAVGPCFYTPSSQHAGPPG